MKLEEFKAALKSLSNIAFELPNGQLVPSHFHVTEVGKVSKNFIDCGGVLRQENVVNFQLWEANDYDHRLHPEKLLNIITIAENVLNISNDEIEVEYQGETIGKYGIEIKGNNFALTPKVTDCLAKDSCGISESKIEESQPNNSCAPGSGCC